MSRPRANRGRHGRGCHAGGVAGPEQSGVDPGVLGTFAAPLPWPRPDGLPELAIVGAWAADLDEAPLTDAERRASRRFTRPATRGHYVGSRALARRVLGAWLGTAPDQVPLERRCPHCHSDEHGRPRVAGAPLDLSIAHSGGLVLCALTTHGRVGVDLERRRPLPDAVASWTLAPEDGRRDLLGAWVVKESSAKLTGEGLRRPFASFSLESVHRERTVRRLDDQLPAGYVGALVTDEAHGPAHWLGLPPQ